MHQRAIVVFPSITSATGVRKQLLNKYSIKADITQAPGSISSKGCSYCLLVMYKDIGKVKKASNEVGVTIKGVYTEDGTRI